MRRCTSARVSAGLLSGFHTLRTKCKVVEVVVKRATLCTLHFVSAGRARLAHAVALRTATTRFANIVVNAAIRMAVLATANRSNLHFVSIVRAGVHLKHPHASRSAGGLLTIGAANELLDMPDSGSFLPTGLNVKATRLPGLSKYFARRLLSSLVSPFTFMLWPLDEHDLYDLSYTYNSYY